MPAPHTRDQIVEAADDLFYRQGFEATSFSDIARAVKISRGNFYHHFKSKDAILSAVIERRLLVRHALLNQWQTRASTPAERIRCFIQILVQNRAKIQLYGCPIGTLSTELAKLDHPSEKDAHRLFELFRAWLEGQFLELGCTATQARESALHLLARSQGVATLAQAYRDEEFLGREVRMMHDWLDERLTHCGSSRKSRPGGL